MVQFLLLVLFGTTCLGKGVDHKDTIVTAKQMNVVFANPKKLVPEHHFTRTLPSLSVRPHPGRESLEVLGYTRSTLTKAQEHTHMLKRVGSSRDTDREKHAGRYASETTSTDREKHAGSHSSETTPTDREIQADSFASERTPSDREIQADSYASETTPTDREIQADSYASETTTTDWEKQADSPASETTPTDWEKHAASFASEITPQKPPALNYANYDQSTDLRHKLVKNYIQSDHSANQNQEKLLQRGSGQYFVKEQGQKAEYVNPSHITFTEEHIIRNADVSHIPKDHPSPAYTDSRNTVKTEPALDYAEAIHGQTSSAVAHQQQVFSDTDDGYEMARSQPAVDSQQPGRVQSGQIIAQEAEQELNFTTDCNHNIYPGQQGFQFTEGWHQQHDVNNNKPSHTMSQEQFSPNYTQSSQTMTQEQSAPNYTGSSQTMTQEQSAPNYTGSSQTMTQEQSAPNYTQSSQTMTQEQSVPNYTGSSQTMTQQPVPNYTGSSQTMTQEQSAPNYTGSSQTMTQEQSAPNYTGSSQTMTQEQSAPDYTGSSQTMTQEQSAPNYTGSSQTMTQEQSAPNYTGSSQTMTQEQSAPNYTGSSQTMTQEQSTPNYTGSSQTMTQEQSAPNYTQSSQTMTPVQSTPDYTQSSQTMTPVQLMPDYTQSSQTMTPVQSTPDYTQSSQTMTPVQSTPDYTQSSQTMTPVQLMPNFVESSQTIARDQTIILEQQESKYIMSSHVTVEDQHSLKPAPTTRTEHPRSVFHKPAVIPKSTSNINILYYTPQNNQDILISGSDKKRNKLKFSLFASSSANNSRKSQMNPLPCSVFVLDNDTIANCSFRHYTTLPENGIPATITKFYIQGNFIPKLCNNSFKNYPLLRILDLSKNKLSELEEFTFRGLENLTLLNLSDNRLTMDNSTFPEHVFSSLIRLEELYLNKNNIDCKYKQGLNYPDKALSYLRSLMKLSMDGLYDKDFGPGFQNLTSLIYLSMSGFTSGCCNMNSLTSLTFQYLTQLQYLNISSCYILGNNIHREAFSPLQNLVSLDMTHNEDIDIENLDKVFYSLRNITTLKELRMKLIVNRYSLGICLDSSFITNFPQHLEYFDAQENNLEGLDRQVIGLLSPSLKTLDVSGNKFVFGTYLQDLHLMKNLTKLKLNGGGFVYRLPDRFPFQKYLRGGGPNCTLYGEEEAFPQNYSPFIVRLPPNLESIDMNAAGLTYVLSNLTVDPDNKLKKLSMNTNTFPFLEGTFVGLNQLEYLDLSSSYVGTISDKFFINLTSLEILKLGENLLGDFFSKESSPLVFRPLTNLKYLDLSFNDIRSLSPNVFSGLDNLHTLLLKKNPFTDFDINISHMNNLTLLNLTRSKVYNLPARVRQHIDLLVRGGQKVVIDMTQCPIYCTCLNLHFLIWIKTSGVFVHQSPNYLCVYDDNSSKYITDGYNSTIEFLTKKCGSNTLLFLCVAGAMVLLFCVIVFSVLYRFRWKLRYLYYAAHMYFRSAKRAKEITQFEYDAFISYDEADDRFVIGKMAFELEKRGLNLCIHGRDFQAGDYIASNIVRAVCASRRTVVVLTQHMISSYWCKYEIQMANMEAVYTGRRVLLFLLMESIPDDALGVELLYYIKNNTYIPYPKTLPDATSIGKLWDKLVADIRD